MRNFFVLTILLISWSTLSGTSNPVHAQSRSARPYGVSRIPPTPPTIRNGLPPTVLDSFVKEAHERAEQIYGDEGINGAPPYAGFTQEHRINTGIFDVRNQGLTTGHGSWLPDAWGRDEFFRDPDFSQSGVRAEQPRYPVAFEAIENYYDADDERKVYWPDTGELMTISERKESLKKKARARQLPRYFSINRAFGFDFDFGQGDSPSTAHNKTSR